MAHSTFTIKTRWPSGIAAGLVLVLTFGTLGAVILRADFMAGLGAADWAAVRFTVTQAFVSAALSCILAIPVARALSRRAFRGRSVLITLLGAPFLLPVVVAVFGILAVFGRGGILNSTLAWAGLPQVSIYGFQGVILGHVFFNLPLVTRLILQGWLAIPSERFRLAASLDGCVSQLLERPMLRTVLPGAFLVVFLISLTSFAVALTLGGGPRATTVELAIYQALRFDFDLGRAAMLALVQFGLCVGAGAFVWRFGTANAFGIGLDRRIERWDGHGWLDGICIGLATLFLILPLGMVVLRGLPGLLDLPADIWWAAGRSLLVATASATLCMALALALSLRGGALVAIVGVLPRDWPVLEHLSCHEPDQTGTVGDNTDKRHFGASFCAAGHWTVGRCGQCRFRTIGRNSGPKPSGLDPTHHVAATSAPHRVWGRVGRGAFYGGLGGDHSFCRRGRGNLTTCDVSPYGGL